MIRKLIIGADQSVLRTPAARVTDFGQPLQDLVRDLHDTMLAPQAGNVTGIGLAAPQIGIAQQVMLVTLNVGHRRKERKIVTAINPEIVAYSTATCRMEEGCLSLPDLYDHVVRPTWVKVRWQNPAGHWCERKFDGWDARIWQHELDHLHGRMFIDFLEDKYTDIGALPAQAALGPDFAGASPA